LLGASGDSERPARWEDAKRLVELEGRSVLELVLREIRNIPSEMKNSSGELPERLLNIEQVKQDIEKKGKFLTSVSKNLAAVHRLKRAFVALAGDDGHQLLNILTALVSGDHQSLHRDIFYEASILQHCAKANNIDLEQLGEGGTWWGFIKNLPSTWWQCGIPQNREHPYFKLLQKFGGTQLKKDLDWLEDFYDQNSGEATETLFFPPFILDVGREPKKYEHTLALMMRIKPRFAEIVRFVGSYSQYLSGASRPVSLELITDEMFQKMLVQCSVFMLDQEHGLLAMLDYAQE
jgi:hypothetical protein